jgi:hypothetical protein
MAGAGGADAMLQKVNENLKPTFIRMYASKIMSFPSGLELEASAAPDCD